MSIDQVDRRVDLAGSAVPREHEIHMKETGMIKTTRSPRTTRARIAAFTVALTLAAVALLPAASPAQAAGLTNCVELAGRSGACWESVWVDGVERRMVFAQTAREFPGAISSDRVDNFYVTAPQADMPQGALPFPHDHTVANAPAHNGGDYVTRLRGFLVFCSAEGIASGGCVPAPGNMPLARTVNGQTLTSVEAIESPANSGLLILVDTGATFAATITGN